MAQANQRTVQKRGDEWTVVKPGASRVSATAGTQAEAITRAREILANDGGGELRTRGVNGQIRAQDTIKPGNDPSSRQG